MRYEEFYQKMMRFHSLEEVSPEKMSILQAIVNDENLTKNIDRFGSSNPKLLNRFIFKLEELIREQFGMTRSRCADGEKERLLENTEYNLKWLVVKLKESEYREELLEKEPRGNISMLVNDLIRVCAKKEASAGWDFMSLLGKYYFDENPYGLHYVLDEKIDFMELQSNPDVCRRLAIGLLEDIPAPYFTCDQSEALALKLLTQDIGRQEDIKYMLYRLLMRGDESFNRAIQRIVQEFQGESRERASGRITDMILDYLQETPEIAMQLDQQRTSGISPGLSFDVQRAILGHLDSRTLSELSRVNKGLHQAAKEMAVAKLKNLCDAALMLNPNNEQAKRLLKRLKPKEASQPTCPPAPFPSGASTSTTPPKLPPPPQPPQVQIPRQQPQRPPRRPPQLPSWVAMRMPPCSPGWRPPSLPGGR